MGGERNASGIILLSNLILITLSIDLEVVSRCKVVDAVGLEVAAVHHVISCDSSSPQQVKSFEARSMLCIF